MKKKQERLEKRAYKHVQELIEINIMDELVGAETVRLDDVELFYKIRDTWYKYFACHLKYLHFNHAAIKELFTNFSVLEKLLPSTTEDKLLKLNVYLHRLQSDMSYYSDRMRLSALIYMHNTYAEIESIFETSNHLSEDEVYKGLFK